MQSSKLNFYSTSKGGKLKRDNTVKLSGLFSPSEKCKTDNNLGLVTQQNWINKKDILNNKDVKRKKSLDLQSFDDPISPLFNQKMTNAEALHDKGARKNNFLKGSITQSGLSQVRSKNNSVSSNGFASIRKQLKRGSKKKRGSSVKANDFAFQSSKLKVDYLVPNRKLMQKKKSRAPTLVKLNGDSPYMEYLPDLYREYRPEEKKLKTKNNNTSMIDFYKKMDKAYSDVHSVGLKSRSGSREIHSRMSRHGSTNKSLNKMNSFRSQSSVKSRGANSVSSNRAKFRKKPKKNKSSNDDSFLKLAQMVKNKVYQKK
jgi:hypothetical protein